MYLNKLIALLGLAASLASLPVQAGLNATDGGLGVYDSGLDAVWTADANLLGTFEYSQGAANFINAILSISPTITDSNGVYTVTTADFGSHAPANFNAGDYGSADWWGAQAFINYLNNIAYAGSSQWALPGLTVSGVSGGELGELFYNEMGGTPGNLVLTGTPFSNIQGNAYWAAENPGNPSQAGDLTTSYGYPGFTDKTSQAYVMAISPSPVPLPGTLWLTGFALPALGLIRKAKVAKTA